MTVHIYERRVKQALEFEQRATAYHIATLTVQHHTGVNKSADQSHLRTVEKFWGSTWNLDREMDAWVEKMGIYSAIELSAAIQLLVSDLILPMIIARAEA